MARVVHCSAEFNSLPMVIYGTPPVEEAAAKNADGFTHLVPISPTLLNDTGGLLAKLLN